MNLQNLSRKVWQDPFYFVAFGFGSGLLPLMPGTWGTLAAIPIYLLLVKLGWVGYAICTILIGLFGIYASDKVSKDLGVHDYKGIVIDEIVGLLLTLFLIPIGWKQILAGFVLFRIFDIWKPFPIGYLDKQLKGGLGIVLDDIIAALYAWVVLIILTHGVL